MYDPPEMVHGLNSSFDCVDFYQVYVVYKGTVVSGSALTSLGCTLWMLCFCCYRKISRYWCSLLSWPVR